MSALPPDLSNLSNTELAILRTELAGDRTELAKDRNRLAAERTLMAWIRTSLSMISFGFGIDRFFKYLQQSELGNSINRLSEERVLGLSLIALGVFALAAAIAVHWRTLKNLEEPQFKYLPSWSLGIVVAVILAFIGLASYIPLIAQDVKLRDVFTLDSQIIQNLASITVFAIMLAVGVELPLGELGRFWQQPGLWGRSFLAAVVLPPLVVISVISLLKIPTTVAIALGVLAAAPSAPLLTKRASLAGARPVYGASLQITLALLSVVVTPLILSSFRFWLPDGAITSDPLTVAQQVAWVQFLPLSIGLGTQGLFSEIAQDLSRFLATVANILFAVLALFALVIALPFILSLGWPSLGVIALVTLLWLVIGHLMGQGWELDMQSGLAISTLARNVGLAIFLVTVNEQSQLVPPILSALVVGAAISLPYSGWMKRRIAQGQLSQASLSGEA